MLWQKSRIACPGASASRTASYFKRNSPNCVSQNGSVSIPAEQRFLASISPYHNLHADKTYPEPLIFTTTKDDRVGPVHARKFAARLEELNKPFFYQEIIEGGHGAGADLKQTANTLATQYTYLIRKLMD